MSYTFDRCRFLIIHGQDPDEWAARHDIEPFEYPCYECGEMLSTTVPFAAGPLRGLKAPECVCGHTRTPYCLVRVDGEDLLGVSK